MATTREEEGHHIAEDPRNQTTIDDEQIKAERHNAGDPLTAAQGTSVPPSHAHTSAQQQPLQNPVRGRQHKPHHRQLRGQIQYH